MTVRYYKDYYNASWPQQHNKVVLYAVFTKAYSFFKMQPKNRREVKGQLANVAGTDWATVLGSTQSLGWQNTQAWLLGFD